MREILFRGKSKSTGKWVYEKIVSDDDLIGELCFFTGMTDKNGQRVFEGDILKFDWTRGEQYIGEVVWDSEYASFDIKPHAENINAYFGIMNSDEFEVIGNIHDNPELLKSEVQE